MKDYFNLARTGVICAAVFLAGCAGQSAFTTAARPGETIAMAVGWKQALTRNDLTVEITPQTGPLITYNPGDSRVRTLVQGYLDPVSKLIISDRAGVTYPDSGLQNNDKASGYDDLSPSWAGYVRSQTGDENDWSDTIIFVDLPTTIAAGAASIRLLSANVQLATPIGIEVLPVAAGPRNHFGMSNYFGLGALIRSAERAPHYIVRFNGPAGVIPHSIQADFARTLAASGNAWVTHPRGDIQSTMWSDTGSLIKVMLTPVKGTSVDRLTDFKFYVTGAVTSLTTNSIKAYDIAGNPLSGFSASIQFVNN